MKIIKGEKIKEKGKKENILKKHLRTMAFGEIVVDLLLIALGVFYALNPEISINLTCKTIGLVICLSSVYAIIKYVDLKKKWQVSILAMIIRANRLGLLDDSHYQNNVKRLSAKGWRSREPLDDILTKVQPTLLQKSIDLLFENDVFDADSFIEELKENHISMNPDEVENLLHLTKGKLSTKKTEEQSVGLKLKCTTKTSNKYS